MLHRSLTHEVEAQTIVRRRRFVILKSLVTVGLITASACASRGAASLGVQDSLIDELNEVPHPKPPLLPFAGGAGESTPWGGTDATRWRPEAVLANASSEALNRAWALPNVRDVVVAVPTKMMNSDYHPYVDGQSNSVSSFNDWTAKRPPLVGTLVKFVDGRAKVFLRFDRTLSLAQEARVAEVRYTSNGAVKSVDVPLELDTSGDATGEWVVPEGAEIGSLTNSSAVAVHPKGFTDWFPLWFRMPVRATQKLRASSIAFADGRSLFDRERVSIQGVTAPPLTPFEQLNTHTFSAPYNTLPTVPARPVPGTMVPFTPDNIHARFPTSKGISTATGKGWTWVADERPGGFKVLYTCFEARDPEREVAANGGVPSGGGWHYIGDAAETIVNDLEAGPIVVGAATTNPLAPSALGSGTFAWGLSDVATIRWLYPGEAFVTLRGGIERSESGETVERLNYHWFIFHQPKNVCTEEIVNLGAVPPAFDP